MAAADNAGEGKPIANEIVKAPGGFLIGIGDGAQVLPGGLTAQFKLRTRRDS